MQKITYGIIGVIIAAIAVSTLYYQNMSNPEMEEVAEKDVEDG